MKLLLAIDPGVSGGVAVLTGDAIETHPMPGSLADVVDLLRSYTAADKTLVVEEVPKFCGRNLPASSVFVMAQNFGRIEGAAIALGWRMVRVHPKQWQKAHGLVKSGATQGEWKRRLRALAAELYPGQDVTLKTADALLILDWARRANL